MDINVGGKKKVMRLSRQPSPECKNITDQKQLENAKYFSYVGGSDEDLHVTCNPSMAKAACNKIRTLFNSKLDL
jgi:hypothetical protein